MRVSAKVDYALRAVTELAGHWHEDEFAGVVGIHCVDEAVRTDRRGASGAAGSCDRDVLTGVQVDQVQPVGALDGS